MKFKLLWIAALLTSVAFQSHAQNERDAFLFSQESVHGTARYNALGGAMTALGGDVSAVYLNPAGLGVYNKSEWGVSVGLHSNFSETNFLNQSTLSNKTNGNIPTASFILSNDNLPGKWKSGTFGVVLHRSNTFHRETTYVGSGSSTSLLDDYLNVIDDNNVSWQALNDAQNPAFPYDIHLAWSSYLIDVFTPEGTNDEIFFSATGLDPIDQSYSETISGARRQTALSYGANYDDKLYLGAGVVFSRIVYDKRYDYTETTAQGDTTTFLNDFVYQFDESTSGLGVGFNAGLIYRPLPALRVGASITSPIRYNLDIEFESSIAANYIDTSFFFRSPFEGFYNYRVRSPWRSNLGLAYVIGKYGLISLDAEFVNYPGTRIFDGSDGYSFSEENIALNTQLENSINLRAGGEYRVTSNWFARAGFAYFSNPYAGFVDDNAGFQLYSGGLGYKDANYFIDVSYQYKRSQMIHYAYDQGLANRADVRLEDHFLTASLGFRF